MRVGHACSPSTANLAPGRWSGRSSIPKPDFTIRRWSKVSAAGPSRVSVTGPGLPSSRAHRLRKSSSTAFATELARLLDHEYDVNSYASLVIVAPPHFLGMLRKAISAKVTKHLTVSLDKDYSQLPAARTAAPLG